MGNAFNELTTSTATFSDKFFSPIMVLIILDELSILFVNLNMLNIISKII